MRLFAALAPDPAALEKIRDFTARARQRVPLVKWTRPENIHLTLHFLGEMKEQDLPVIREGLASAAAGVAPFSFQLDKKGLFRGRGSSILWIGASDAAALLALASRVQGALRSFGDPKPFKAHLTIARAGREVGEEELAAIPWEPSPYQCATMHLIQSQLLPAGAKYTVLSEFPLK